MCSVLDYSVEGKEEEASFDECMNKVIGLVKFADEKDAMPIVVFKPTGVGRFAIWQKLTEGSPLTPEEQLEWERIKQRMHAICKIAKERDVEVLIDGEESWMQDAADDMVAELMAT